MKLLRGAITWEMKNGNVFNGGACIRVNPSSLTGERVRNCPDDWFIRVVPEDGRFRLVPLTSHFGYMYLSRKGYEANKKALQKAFDKANAEGQCGHTQWSDVEVNIQKFFATVKDQSLEALRKMKVDVADLTQLINEEFWNNP